MKRRQSKHPVTRQMKFRSLSLQPNHHWNHRRRRKLLRQSLR
jgi:hypothetical protein